MINKSTIEKTPEGALIKTVWQDASGDVTQEGSAEDILRGHIRSEYSSFGLYVGVAEDDLIISSDFCIQTDEFRGIITVPIHWIKSFKIIQKKPNA